MKKIFIPENHQFSHKEKYTKIIKNQKWKKLFYFNFSDFADVFFVSEEFVELLRV